jgi:hypothetical protein
MLKKSINSLLSVKMITLFFILAAVASCNSLDSIPYSPVQTPEMWLSHQPYIIVKSWFSGFILMQPSSTIIVYLLGIITLWIGVDLLKNKNKEQSKMWWGIALILWGIGALLAGTSYQAFSYEIKCAGRQICKWTSWLEIYYLIFSAASIDAMMIATSFSSTSGKRRKSLITYVILKCFVYSSVIILGALLPIRFLVSFELLVIVSAPAIALLLLINFARYKKYKQKSDLALIGNWLLLGLTIGFYFLYYMLGLTEKLYQKGVWFSANDVLHIGLIGWMLYIWFVISPKLSDLKTSGKISLFDID